MSLDRQIAALVADGYEVVQQGRIVAAPALGVSFAERAEGFRIGLLGSYPPPTYRSQYDNRLLDDDERWAHLRRGRPSAE